MDHSAPQFSPYKGLQPYTEADRAYFFGRERDREIIIANLYAAPLTVLYGASGVGKSSVLLAGVVPALKETPRAAVVVFRDWQAPEFKSALKRAVQQAITKSGGKAVTLDLQLPFDEFLARCWRGRRGELFFIFDQFEEYFLYHPASAAEDSFDAELALAINRPEIPANFLLAMREDGLSKLDRFQGRIPNLLGNLLRLEHLDRQAAEEAIRKPLAEYNRQSGQTAVNIEGALVEALLKQIKTDEVLPDQVGQGKIQQSDEHGVIRIETPLLQMVLTRLWDDEMQHSSRSLQLSTLVRLGGGGKHRPHASRQGDGRTR